MVEWLGQWGQTAWAVLVALVIGKLLGWLHCWWLHREASQRHKDSP